jgi:hypothetical protein
MATRKNTLKAVQASQARTHEQKSEAAKKAAQTRQAHAKAGQVTSFEKAGRRGAASRWGHSC